MVWIYSNLKLNLLPLRATIAIAGYLEGNV